MTERNINLTIGALTLGLAFSIGALAEGISKDSYQAEKKSIEAEYKAAISACAAMQAEQKDVCIARAKSREKIGLAELKAYYQPSTKTQYQARITKAEAEYAVAREQCDGKAGDAKAACVKDAKAAEASAKANAETAMK